MAMEVSPSGQIQEFVAVLKRRRWQIILPALFVLLLGTVFAVIVPKKFVIKTEIELREANYQAADDNRRTQKSPVDSESEVLENHLRNFSRISGILEQNIEEWPSYAQADRRQRHGLVEGIIKNLKVDAPPPKEGSTFVKIAYQDVLAERGEKFLSSVVKVAIDDILTAEKDRLGTEIATLQKIHDEVDDATSRARTAWQSFARQKQFEPDRPPGTSTRDAPSKYQRFEGRLEFLHKKLIDSKLAKEILETKIERLEEELGAMEPSVVALVQAKALDADKFAETILAGEAALEKAQNALDNLQPGTKAYSQRLALRDDIAGRLALARAINLNPEPNTTQEPNPEYLAREKEIKDGRTELYLQKKEQLKLEEDILETESSMDALTVVGAEAAEIWRERMEAEAQLKLAVDELSIKKKALTRTKLITREVIMVVATPAYASETAETPNPYLIIGFSLFAGLGLGLVLAMLSEYARNSYRSVPDLASVMSVPVIGSIGLIVTRREAQRSLGLKLLVGLPTAIILLGISWMTWTWADESTRNTLPVPVQQAIDGIRISLLNM